MNLEEARKWAPVSRENTSSIHAIYEDEVIVALDDRITELEAERDELLTEKHYNTAIARIEKLMDAKPDTAEMNELDMLTAFVEIYEDEHFPIGGEDKK